MPLTFTGVKAPMVGATSYQARDDLANPVTVQASDEALQDHGLAEIQRVADEKYDAGNYAQSAHVRIVTVGASDF